MASPHEAVPRPETRTESVDDLIPLALSGQVRIPAFQRGLAWDSRNVLELFDSIYRGFPIGSLLLQEAPARAEEIRLGPLPVLATERRDAWWVVDGQQRLTSLVAALARPLPLPAPGEDDPFVVYFDAATGTFQSPTRTIGPGSTWIPLPALLDASRLAEWIHGWEHGSDAQLRGRAFDAGKRLREYRVPLYIIRTADEGLLRTIFQRVNSSGKPLTWTQIHDGLFGPKDRQPSTLEELAASLESLGMGRPDDDVLLACLIAYRGLDVMRSFREHQRKDPHSLEGVAAAAQPVLRTAIGFLRARCAVPHLRLLPYPAILVVLTRFFEQHREPNERSLALLVRWVWRALLDPAHDDRALRRRGVAAVGPDEEASVQALLALVPRTRSAFALPATFDARSAQSRLVLLGMAALHPRRLGDAAPLDVSQIIRERDLDAFRPLFPADGDRTRSPANRILLPGAGPAHHDVRAYVADLFAVRGPPFEEVLASHALDRGVAAAILADDVEQALARRAALLVAAVQALGDRMAAWGRSDRPSLEYLMKVAGP